jgi:hypothetical protein
MLLNISLFEYSEEKYSVNLIVSISYRCMMDSQVCPLFCYMLVHESSL